MTSVKTATVKKIRADQDTGGAVLKFSMKTATHGTPRISSGTTVCDNYQGFTSIVSSVAVAQWVRALDY